MCSSDLEGLTRRVLPDTVKKGGDIIEIPGDGFMNLARTQSLWKEFKGPEALTRKGDWVDRPSVGIPFLYVHLGYLLSDAERTLGKRDEANATLKRAFGVAKAARLDSQVPMPDTVGTATAADSLLRKQVPVTKSEPAPKAPRAKP